MLVVDDVRSKLGRCFGGLPRRRGVPGKRPQDADFDDIGRGHRLHKEQGGSRKRGATHQQNCFQLMPPTMLLLRGLACRPLWVRLPRVSFWQMFGHASNRVNAR
jgi:hypothetical protein